LLTQFFHAIAASLGVLCEKDGTQNHQQGETNDKRYNLFHKKRSFQGFFLYYTIAIMKKQETDREKSPACSISVKFIAFDRFFVQGAQIQNPS
jgi:hypothetical protein